MRCRCSPACVRQAGMCAWLRQMEVSMRYTPVLIIGAGQAGLAMSNCLSTSGIEHVILERGRVAERWHSERWDSLRLLTPNWMSRLPSWSYSGTDSDGFM